MPISMDTQYPTAVVIRYEGSWTWDEYRKLRDESEAVISRYTAPIDVIIDMQNSTLPRDMLSGFRRDAMSWNANVRRIIVVGASQYIITMYRLFTGVYTRTKKRLLLVKTMNEALELSREPNPDNAPHG